jgi:hypothetical protein
MNGNGKEPNFRIVGVLKKNGAPFVVATGMTREVAENVSKLLAHSEVEGLRIEEDRPTPKPE